MPNIKLRERLIELMSIHNLNNETLGAALSVNGALTF